MNMKKTLKITILLIALVFIFCACGNKLENLPGVSSDIDFSQSPYSHITNGGQYSKSESENKSAEEGMPYDIDAITCATLTIEGPAMKESVPFAIGSLESYDKVLVRGLYQDDNGVKSYEGVDLWCLLNDLSSEEKIAMTDTAYKVVIKNSNRAEIESFTLEEVKAAHEAGRPIILAYGVGTRDEKTVAPFVFNGKTEKEHSLGYEKALKNDDGCLRLVYDYSEYGVNHTSSFQNAAYVYVCEETTPGFRHSDSTKDVYKDSSLTDYIISIRGAKLGYELDFTTAQLEALVHYDANGNIAEGGLGYRDEYSLANNTYWYVNEYEGLKLYDLLLYAGMPSAEDFGDKKAKTTLVTFLASDGVTSSEKFSVDTLSYPDAFGFYNKNAADNNDGSYVSTNEDLVDLGYPVLLAYGFNEYPYVIGKKDDGFLSGLGNSGGPFRVIFGKMNYNHANGSNQVQYVSDIIVGGDIAFSTHLESVDEDLLDIASNEFDLRLLANGKDQKVFDGFTIGKLEEVLYGRKVTANDKKKAQIKEQIDGNIYEGVDLAYIVEKTFNVPYYNDPSIIDGSVKIAYAGGELEINLSDLNYDNILLAFAKNGTPLVENASSKGYVKERQLYPVNDIDSAVYNVDNVGGPVELIITDDNGNVSYYENVNSVVVNLNTSEKNLNSLRAKAEAEAKEAENAVPNADKSWNHSMSAEYSALLEKTFELTIANEDNEVTKTFTIAELERFTDCVVRDKYTVMDIGYCEGLDLWKFVKAACGYDPKADGYVAVSDKATANLSEASSVKVVASDAYEIDLEGVFLLEGLEKGITADDGRVLPILLAYGCKGYPFVSSSNDEGYVETADNTYGPIRVITEKSSQSSMKFCVKIEVKVPGTGDILLP